MSDKDDVSHAVSMDGLGTVSRRGMLGLGLGLGLTAVGGSIFGAPGLTKARASTATPPASPSGSVVLGVWQEPVAFHPLMPGINFDEILWTSLFSSLWVAQPDGSLKPDLALEVPSIENGGIAEGGLVWTVRLRDDVKWHDGTPFTAEDVKFTLELINTSGFRARTREGHNLLGEITVNGPHEISWRMTRVFAPYLALLANTHMVPKHVLEGAADPNNTPFNNRPIGTGPFKLGSRTPGDNITLVANGDYHGDGPYMAQAVLKYVPDITALYAQFRTGQVDVLILDGVPQNFYAEARELPDREVLITPSGNVEVIIPNLAHPALGDKAVRQALYYAINKQDIVDAIYYGIPKATESFTPQESWAYNRDLPEHVYDPERANAILDEAGWVRGSNGIRSKDGVTLSFTNSTATGNQPREQVQQLLMQDWAAIGVQLNIENMPGAVVWGEYYTRSQFESVLAGTVFRTGVDPDPAPRFSSASIPVKGGSGANYGQWENAEVDELLKEGQESFDQERRREIYYRLQEIVLEELPIFPILQQAPVEGYRKGLVGFVPNSNQRQSAWNMGSWYWES